jgi:hypothetical protein
MDAATPANAASFAACLLRLMNGLSTSTTSWRGSTGVATMSIISPGVARSATSTKGANLASIDPETGNRVNLFNPRQDNWERHFAIDVSGHIIGLTPAGESDRAAAGYERHPAAQSAADPDRRR